MTTQTTNTLHPFEENNLGLAPFRWIGFEEKVGPIDLGNGMQVGAPGQPMGTCQHCGNGIKDCHWIESADGNRFYVGSTCVEKIYKKSNMKSSDLARDPIYRKVKEETNRIKRERRHAREKAKIAELYAICESQESELKDMPHCKTYWAEQGQTAWDELQWYMQNAGNRGRIEQLEFTLARLEKRNK